MPRKRSRTYSIPSDSGLPSLLRIYTDHFHHSPSVHVSAPGRVNLIGEHTDYNDGYVLPMAINRRVHLLGSPRGDRAVRLVSLTFLEEVSFSLDSFEKENNWADYLKGVISFFPLSPSKLSGFNALVWSDIPLGAGLSSSAALEIAAFTFLSALCGLEVSGKERALLCQKAENQYVGVSCGIMDQFISSLGKKERAILLDCRGLRHQYVPLELGRAGVVVVNTMVKRSLRHSAYNRRREECRQGTETLKQHRTGSQSLRDFSVQDLSFIETVLSGKIAKRIRHVVTENDRVLKAAEALQGADLALFGDLLKGSHASLRDDYEVSCAELDFIADTAAELPGVLGARMTGAGFGGCAVCLVEKKYEGGFAEAMAQSYKNRYGVQPEIYSVHADEGASVHALP